MNTNSLSFIAALQSKNSSIKQNSKENICLITHLIFLNIFLYIFYRNLVKLIKLFTTVCPLGNHS